VSLNRLNKIVLGKRGITAGTVLRLARFLTTSLQLSMRLRADWDLQRDAPSDPLRPMRCTCVVPDTPILSESAGLRASDRA
jgi:plasmid maintenance system antidote protein VapI